MTKKNWELNQVAELFNLPFLELLYQAQKSHRENFDNTQMQLSTLLSIKTGTCPEDCSYCPQSGHYKTEVEKEKLLDLESVIAKATQAKATGATRFCMGAAWRNPPKKDFPKVLEMIKAVKKLGMEACVTLGMLDEEQAQALKEAGLDYYNHNLDTSPEYYSEVITTRTYDDRLDTLEHVRNAGMNTCCGGIIGMGETRDDRLELLRQLANLPSVPESVPINRLIPIPGTPLAETQRIDPFEFVRTIAVARIMMPQSMIRLSAGREDMTEEMHALCYMAGANSIFVGDTLLTAKNPAKTQDMTLLTKLGMAPQALENSDVTC